MKEIALTVHQGRQKCAVDRGDFIAKLGIHDRYSATMCFKSVSLHSGPIDEPVLAVDAHVSIAGCAACLNEKLVPYESSKSALLLQQIM